MATTIFCIEGRMGSTTYYIGKLKVGDLIRSVGFAHQLPEWESMTVDERIQREVAEDRVKKEIVPYLQADPHRFFGAMIVDIYKGWENLEFEHLTTVVKGGIPKAYLAGVQDAGFLTLPGADDLVALDGQHRLKALIYAVRGDGEKVKAMPSLVEDEITVIFVKHESSEKIRNIFNKVNRYARSTSRGDNIITAEDDAYAILARRLIREGEGLLPPALVNWKSNTLSQRSVQLTTISTIYETIEAILEDKTELQGKVKTRPSEEALEEYFAEVHEVWDAVLSGLNDYQELTGETIKEKREWNLLFKPIGQVAMFKGLQLARKLAGLSVDDAVERLNTRIDWNKGADMWENILVKPDKSMIARQEAKDLAAELIVYLIAQDELSTGFIEKLAAKYADKRGEPYAGRRPEEILPEPLEV